jgi:hypothetical protein
MTHTTDIATLATTGTYWGWYNYQTKYQHRNGRIGYYTYEAKGELTILPNGEAIMGDATHGYDHWDFGQRLSNILETAHEGDGPDAYEILEQRGWTLTETRYLLIHDEPQPIINT